MTHLVDLTYVSTKDHQAKPVYLKYAPKKEVNIDCRWTDAGTNRISEAKNTPFKAGTTITMFLL